MEREENYTVKQKEEFVCLNCKSRFIQERPLSTPLIAMECPKCRKKGFVIRTGEEVFYEI